MYLVSHSKVKRSHSEPRAFLREAPVCKKLTPKLVPIRPKNYRSMLVPCHDTMPSLMIFKHVLELQGLKNKFLNLSSVAIMPRCLNFTPISCMDL